MRAPEAAEAPRAAREYVEALLPLARDPERLLAERERHLARQRAAGPAPRRATDAVLARIARELATGRPDDLRAELEALDLARWPGLERWRRRLIEALPRMACFEAARQDGRVERALVEMLWEREVLPPCDAAASRAHVRAYYVRGGHQKLVDDLRELRQRHPDLVARHREWLGRFQAEVRRCHLWSIRSSHGQEVAKFVLLVLLAGGLLFVHYYFGLDRF